MVIGSTALSNGDGASATSKSASNSKPECFMPEREIGDSGCAWQSRLVIRKPACGRFSDIQIARSRCLNRWNRILDHANGHTTESLAQVGLDCHRWLAIGDCNCGPCS